jgi:uncharacterized membrane protein
VVDHVVERMPEGKQRGMESRFKLAGHAVHPMLVTIPVGMFVGAVAFDIAHLASGSTEPATVAFWMIATGLVGGVLAAVFGVVDWLGVPRGTRAWRVGLLHALANDVVLAAFLVSWLLRRGAEGHEPSALALVLSFGAILVAGVAAWLGGELVERLGVGVDEGANLDAVSSLRASGLVSAHTDPAARGTAPFHR